MREIRKLSMIWVCFLVIPVLAAPGFAWEFKMTGGMYWTFQFANQTGNQGFFGPYNVDNGLNTSTANLNYWWSGPVVAQNTVTGHDANSSYFYVTMEPVIKINPAVRLQGRLRLGFWNVPIASIYFTENAPGADNAMSEAQWTLFWATATMPWGTIGIGKRAWKFGTGLQYDGSDGLSTESLILNAPYGPFDLGIAFYPHRAATAGQTITVDPYDLVVKAYYDPADKSGVIMRDVETFAVYNNGPIQIGTLVAYGAYHIGPEGQLVNPTGLPIPPSVPVLAQDSFYFHGTTFTKYNNGRFFFNGEAAWLYWSDRLTGPALLGVGVTTPPLPSQRDTEQWRYMTETGVMSGPGRLTLLSVWSPGPDRRNSQLIGRQSAAFVWHPTFDTFLGNYDVLRPYSYLFTYNYGAGFDAYNLSLDGYLRDAWVLASRLDYAVAANLNWYGTFLWADRTSNGYGWACISPNDINMPPQFTNRIGNDGNVQFALNGAAGSPNIPDRSLGWEVTTGVDWQILDGLTVGFLAAYWQPGRWFSYACIDRSVPEWNVPSAGNNWGTRPAKTIDPIFGGQFTMNFTF